jgi:hypothetical protein
MSAEIDDGGPAFPHGEIVEDIMDEAGRLAGSRVWAPSKGMKLRDWFAGQALAGLVANINCAYKTQTFARRALELADAMIAARKGGADGN